MSNEPSSDTLCVPRNLQVGDRPVLLRRPQVEADCGLARSTIYLRIAQGLFPRPVSLGPRAVGWPAHEIAAINQARIAGWPDAEIRVLVAKLEAARAVA